ncbi:MAG: response regulator transcription factor [Candidatus Eisenbacteria bacterium]|nr:response regulator transcription factor [Candidatus Eisenbacteria bacterium]
MPPKKPHVVVIEDEPDIVEVIAYNLSREGFIVSPVLNGEEGLRKVRKEAPDLVLLDLMLPGIDGVEICKKLKSDPGTRGIPVIMVTAKGDESDVVLGLGVGADDYLTKPFSPKELVARVKAVLRRGPVKEGVSGETRIRVRNVVIDVGRHEITIGGERVDFTHTEFRLLGVLASRPGWVFSRYELLNQVVGPDTVVIDRSVDVHVNSIRKKLGRHRDLIQTVRGAGYKFLEVAE